MCSWPIILVILANGARTIAGEIYERYSEFLIIDPEAKL